MKTSRHSRQRDILTDILQNTKEHPSADAVYQKAREVMPNISLGTVYRNLAMLTADGSVIRLDVGDGSDRYDANTSPHAHFVCLRCGRVSDIYQDFGTDIISRAAGCTAGIITDCAVTFKGICAECARKESPDGGEKMT